MTDTNHSESTTLNCPRCSAELADRAEGLCPRCLMAEVMQPTADGAGCTSFPPHSPQELAPYFPQLEIVECLGRGGMGVVYKARQKSLNRLVALKLLVPERSDDPRFAERFEKEALALAALSHPNIVSVYDFGRAGDFFFLLMEFVDGVNLRQLMLTKKLTPKEALSIVPPICEALQCAHDRGIVHCDIKPENLLIDKSGGVKIADFGIAKIIESPSSETDGDAEVEPYSTQPSGTPAYAAPEQRTTSMATDHRADIFSLGVVLYEMLTGERPGTDFVLPSKRVQIDVRIDEIVLRALEESPELRFASANDFLTEVETVVATNGQVEGRGAAQLNATPSITKVGRSVLTTPEKLSTFAGKFFLIGTRGQLVLDERKIVHSRPGKVTMIPLADVTELSVGKLPYSVNPAGLAMLELSFKEENVKKTVLLSPMVAVFSFPDDYNAHVVEWYRAIWSAIVAATGSAPPGIMEEQMDRSHSTTRLVRYIAVVGLIGIAIASAIIYLGTIVF